VSNGVKIKKNFKIKAITLYIEIVLSLIQNLSKIEQEIIYLHIYNDNNSTPGPI